MKILDFNVIQNLNVSPQTILNWVDDVWRMKNECILPAKVKMYQGESGRYITMPCVIPSLDVAGVKFISRNMKSRFEPPARNSNIMIQKCSEMGLLAVCDGIWITNMRTGAIAANSFFRFKSSDTKNLGMMGLGSAADAFFYFVENVYPGNLTVKLLRYKDQAENFIERHAKNKKLKFEIVDSVDEICSCDVVVSAVGSAEKCFAESDIFKPGCLVIPIHQGGFQNCDLVFDKIIIDDHNHVKGCRYYEQFKTRAIEMSNIVCGNRMGRDNDAERVVAYCGGIALHDIYFAYRIYELAIKKGKGVDLPMELPKERFWIR